MCCSHRHVTSSRDQHHLYERYFKVEDGTLRVAECMFKLTSLAQTALLLQGNWREAYREASHESASDAATLQAILEAASRESGVNFMGLLE